MKKYMVADLVKDIRSNLIIQAQEEYNLSNSDAEIFVTNFPNSAVWPDVEGTAESLGIDIADVEDDDVENWLEMGGTAKGVLDSSVGIIQWIYDNTLKAYLILMMLGDKPIMYKVDKEMMIDWKNSESSGEYYNNVIRGNTDIEDPDHSCGCGPNPCEPQEVDRFNTKFASIS